MDTTVTDNVSAIVNTVWTYLYGSTPSFGTPATADQRLQPAVWMGYGGAALAIFLSVFGSYSAGHSAIVGIEASYYAFLQEFQDNEKYEKIMDDEEYGPLMHDFLTYYAWDLFILNGFIFWHVFFLIGMGAGSSLFILYKIKGYDDGETSDVEITVGWKLLLFGMIFGSVDYLCGMAISDNQNNLMKLVGFTP